MAPKNMAVKRLFAAAIQTRSYSAPADRSIPAAKQKYVPTSGTYPKGFLAGSAFAGVKASNTKYDDLALVASEQPCAASATFTRNLFKAAPVQFSRPLIAERRHDGFRGVLVNSGCANAVTGKVGLDHAEDMSKATDKAFGDEGAVPSTLVMSTGVIGQRLPIDRITQAIPKVHANLGSSHDHWLNAAQAICTTDTFPKLLSRQFTLPSDPNTTYSIAGMTKGAGMIHPNMATLLGIVCTDVKIAPDAIHDLLRFAVNTSFNCISIDGDTSTNDTVAFFANGAAAPPDSEPLQGGTESSAPPLGNGRRKFSEDMFAMRGVLRDFLQDLAKLVVRDGEGATKFVTIRVRSTASYFTAKRAAISIARSALVKTALYGKDANWGRILCAIGYAPGLMTTPELPLDHELVTGNRGVGTRIRQVDAERTSVSFVPTDGSAELKLLVKGEPETVDEERAKQILEHEDLEILVDLNDEASPPTRTNKNGQVVTAMVHEAVFWTCDFSHEYVTINGDYRT